MKKILTLMLLMTFAFAVGWAEATVVFNETFDKCAGTGDASTNGSQSAISATNLDNSGWEFQNGYAANKCARFGTSSAKGTATTPALSNLNGAAVLTFKACAWNHGQETTDLTLSISGGGTINKTSFTLAKGAWTEYTVNITGGTSTTKITFAAKNSSRNRFFLDEVMVTQDANALATPTINVPEGSFFTGDHASVTISHNDTDATILYSLDGSAPATPYTGALDITATTTIKAKAVKGETSSEVVEETITFGSAVSTLADFKNLSTGTTFKFNGTVVATHSYVSTNKSVLWIKDATGYGLVFGSNISCAQGTQFQPGWTGNKVDFNGLTEITNATIEVLEGNPVTVVPENLTAEDVTAEKQATYGTIHNLKVTAVSGKNISLEGNPFACYNDYGITVEAGKTYDITGVVSVNNNNPQFIPTAIEEVVPTEPTVTFTPEAGTYNAPQNVRLTVVNVEGDYILTYKINDGAEQDYDNSVGIDIAQSCTLKAILLTEDMETYEFSAEYIIDTSLKTTFVFNTDEGLAELGLSKPAQGQATNLGDGEYKKDVITMTATNGSTATRIWNSNGSLDLRIYNGATLTLTADEGYKITEISSNGGGLSFTSEQGVQSHTFEFNATTRINTITVKYIPESTDFSVSATPEPGAFTEPITVTLQTKNAADGDVEIYYTTNGDDPSESGTLYENPFVLYQNCNLKVYAIDEDLNEATFEGAYTFNIPDLAITATPDAGTYTGAQEVTLTSNAFGEVEWIWEFTPAGGGAATQGDNNTVTITESGELYVYLVETLTGREVESLFNYVINEPVNPEDCMIVFVSNQADKNTALTATTYADEIEKGADLISGIENPKYVYGGKSGLKISSSNNKGSITFNLANTYNATSISVVACTYGSDNGHLGVNGSEGQALTSEYMKYDFPVNGLVNSITLAATSLDRFYVKGIDINGTVVTLDALADVLADPAKEGQTVNLSDELAVVYVNGTTAYAATNVAENASWVALDLSGISDAAPAEDVVYANVGGTVTNIGTNPVIAVTNLSVVDEIAVAQPVTIDLAQVFDVPGNAVVNLAGYVDANGKIRAFNTTQTHGGQSIDLDRSMLASNIAFVEGTKYNFSGVMTLKEAWTESAPRRVAPGDLDNRYYDNYTLKATDASEATITAVEGVTAGKAVKSVRYYDVAGRASMQPVEGMNIVVTEFQDGTQIVSKVMR